MEFIDRLGDLLAKPQPVSSIPVFMSTRLIDGQLDVIVGSTICIQTDLEKAVVADIPVLTNCIDKIKSVEGDLPILKEEILSHDNFEGRLERASHTDHTISELRVTIYQLMEKAKKELA